MTPTFPNSWKIARFNPIRKKNNTGNVSEYRPIALLPVLSKVVEHVLKKQLVTYIDRSSFLYDCQREFRKVRGTSMLLLGLTDRIRNCVTGHIICILLSLDLKKAVDRVDYFVLIKKLPTVYGLGKSVCKLLFSYLAVRKQFVQIGDITSSTLLVKSGVHQGLLLFILLLNDFFKFIENCTPYAYADDVEIVFVGNRRSLNVLQSKFDLALAS
ncbi:uncharacterized protein LOC131996045 [Stomoxys calcitrans]|uniref:uncharacterized protein LOC131996045 n=1 Tax=Stomoxys calcitrans TaxID=35570 RepID=UPI0027E2FCFB|nr:uncharacterized protein LOC131996045 [Stomoxys calcitrans]